MATALAYSAPSRDQLAQDIRRYKPAMYLYQGSPEWLSMEIFGSTFWLPPHLEGEPMVDHPVRRIMDSNTGNPLGPETVKADGLLAVRDIYGILRDKKMMNRPTGIGLLDGQDAGAIVMFAVENYGERGVVWLRGDETDNRAKDVSKKLYARFIRGWAKSEQDTRTAFVAMWNVANKGRVPPPPTDNQNRAQEILDTLAVDRRSGAEFICTVAYDWEGNSWEKYARHMKAAHGRIEQRPKDDTAERPGRARTVSAAELAALVNPPEGESVRTPLQPLATTGHSVNSPAKKGRRR
jgi:hypothetical protein